MRLSLYSISVAPSVLQPVLAAVTSYGELGFLGDSTDCTSVELDDNALANLLEMENSQEATRNGDTFNYPDDLACGSDYAFAVGTSCTGLGGQATCNKALLPRSRIMPQESKPTQQLSKKSAVYCKDASAECDNSVNGDVFGNCPTGYTGQEYTARGQVAGLFCTKPCTQDQLDQCLGSVCKYKRDQCSIYPGNNNIYGDTLIKCRMLGPVSMLERICTDNLIPSGPANVKCTGCVSYANGQCKINDAAFEAFEKSSGQATERFILGLANSRFGTTLGIPTWI